MSHWAAVAIYQTSGAPRPILDRLVGVLARDHFFEIGAPASTSTIKPQQHTISSRLKGAVSEQPSGLSPVRLDE
jgi:hypothetical protein